MGNYWTDRAVPVLQALESPPEGFLPARMLTLRHRGGENPFGLDLSHDAIYDTLLQLRDAEYVEWGHESHEGGGSVHLLGLQVTGRGLQVLGEWPRFEALISPLTFAALLEALADYLPEEEAASMKRAAGIARGMGAKAIRALIFGAGSQLARHALGLP